MIKEIIEKYKEHKESKDKLKKGNKRNWEEYRKMLKEGGEELSEMKANETVTAKGTSSSREDRGQLINPKTGQMRPSTTKDEFEEEEKYKKKRRSEPDTSYQK